MIEGGDTIHASLSLPAMSDDESRAYWASRKPVDQDLVKAFMRALLDLCAQHHIWIEGESIYLADADGEVADRLWFSCEPGRYEIHLAIHTVHL